MDKQIAHIEFENIAAAYGDNVAVEYADLKVTYAELNSYANRLSNALLVHGLEKGSIVATFFENSLEYVASILGINKAGGAFMPLELNFPVKRLIDVLNEAIPVTIITHPDSLPAITAILLDQELHIKLKNIICLDLKGGQFVVDIYDQQLCLSNDHLFSDEQPDIDLDGNDTNYIIYTSGSTGKPKIIEGCHKGLSHFIHWEITEFSLKRNVRVSQLTPISFDVSFRDIFVPLLVGGTLCIPEKNLRFQPDELAQWLISSKINLVHCVPTLFRLLTEKIQSFTIEQKSQVALSYILLAGEPLFGKDVLDWRSAGIDGVQLVNIYGPSETTLAKMFHRITESDIASSSIVPLGKAIANTAVLILNHGQLCQIGEPGTIYIKTPFRSKGYLRRPDLTKERFIQNPLHDNFEDIIYDTGDQGKYLENMDVVFLGRNDNQIKIRGNRVELLEVEKVIVSFTAIGNVAVMVINGEDDAELACYYTGNQVDEQELKIYLNNYLPTYMHPSYFIHLAVFPLTSSGKINKSVLPKPDILEKENYETPLNEIEEKLENIWKEVLKLSRVSRNESFFNIGGSSLKGIKIISKIYKQCGILIKLPDLFSWPTIRQLGEFLAKSERKLYYDIKPIAQQPYYEVSNAQRRLWILSHFEEEHTAYNMLYAYKLRGSLAVENLNKALHALIARHESMRTVFINIDGEPKQKILSVDEHRFELLKTDLRAEDNPEGTVIKIANEDWEKPFDLLNGPLLRAHLLYLPDNEFAFIFSIHHIISDGWSSAIWMKEIVSLYNSYVNQSPHTLTDLKIHYKDFTYWQNELLRGPKILASQQYWTAQFTDLPPFLALPGDKSRPVVKTYSAKQFGLAINKDITEGLKNLGNEHESTLFMILLSSLNVLFYRLTHQTDITIGTPITGREHEDLEDQIGIYINTLALRTKFESQDSFLKLLKRVKVVTSGAYIHQIYPFDHLIDQLSPGRDLSRTPLFDVMIVLHDAKITAEQSANSMANVEIDNFYIAPSATKFDLNLNFTENNDLLNLIVDYNSDIFSEKLIAHFFSVYLSLLGSIIADPGKSIAKLNILDEPSKAAFHIMNATDLPYPPLATIKQLFEQQVHTNPDAVAVIHGSKQLTYSELNKKSNIIAHHLKIEHKIGVEDPVAVILDRSVDFVAAVLGILKAGAAFVPLDIDFPADRINSILQDLVPKVILSEHPYADKIVNEAKIAILSDSWNTEHGGAIFNPEQVSVGENIAYIIYTSGSTGKPKGVVIENASLVNYVLWANSYYFNNTDGYTFAFNTSISFDLTLTSIFTTLLRGDSLVVYSGHQDIIETLKDIFAPASGIAVVKLTPSHISLIGNLDLKETQLKKIIVGGEELHHRQVAILLGLNMAIEIYNEYGPTEATVGCTVKKITKDAEAISIGAPIANTKIYIADEFGQILPVGVPGEIYIAGRGLARGYYQNESLTREKFFTNPFLGTHHRVYATGDLGKLTVDGEIVFFGRKDRQVKIRGYRIELEEIEKSLLQLGSMKDSFVMIATDKEGEDHLVVYFISESSLNFQDIRIALKQYLPIYMIPLYFVRCDSFPLNANGKLDFDRLPDPFQSLVDQTKVYVAPENVTEYKLVEIWQSVLGKEPIGITDDFFELGGHSLNATRILLRIFKQMDIHVSLKILFTYTTIKTLAAYLNAEHAPPDHTKRTAVANDEDIYII